jgi:hypothetical protein
MAMTQEMFRFVTTRRPERVIMSRIASRLIRDQRQTTRSSMLVKLFGAGLYETKLVTANTFAASVDFLAADDPAILALEPVIAFFREKLEPEIVLADLVTEFQRKFPILAALLQHVPPAQLLESTNAMTARSWDSLYVQTIRGCDRYVSTNYLVDGLRMYHMLRLLWLSSKLQLATWAGAGFDDYDTLIDLHAALAVDSGGDSPSLPDSTPVPQDYGVLQTLAERLGRIDQASNQISTLLKADAVRAVKNDSGEETFFDADAVRFLSKQPALSTLKLEAMPVAEVERRLRIDRELTTLQRQQAFSSLIDPGAARAYRGMTSHALAAQGPGEIAAVSLAYLSAPGGVFRVPLTVGAMKPPAVGDLLLVEQELRRYELGELAEIESIMRGERRERTIRKLARTSQTTTTESSLEQEESSSLKTDERFQLSSQAQQASEQSFGVEAGVNVSGKFGPVQVSASVNASFDTSKSSWSRPRRSMRRPSPRKPASG